MSTGRSIALVYDVAYPFVEGGGQRRMFEIARRFVAWGWNVHWYSLKTWDGPALRTQDGITYHGLKGHADLFAGDGTRSRRAALSFGRAVLLANADFASYDIVWCGQWPYFHILALMARLVPWRGRILVDWWEVWGRHWNSYIGGVVGWVGRLLEWFLARTVTRIGHVVAISDQGVGALVELGARRAGITLIPNGVNTASFATVPAAKGRVDIVSFGRIKDHKNIDHIVSAIAIARDKGMYLTADIVGDGPELAAVKAKAAALAVTSQITFHGRVDDGRLIGLLKRARLFVHPSTKEGGGSITMLEANACGLPIVCYRHPLGVDPKLIIQGRTGLLVANVSAEGLAAGIAEMLQLDDAQPVREDCLAHARAFDWDAIALHYRQLVEGLLDKNHTSGLDE